MCRVAIWLGFLNGCLTMETAKLLIKVQMLKTKWIFTKNVGRQLQALMRFLNLDFKNGYRYPGNRGTRVSSAICRNNKSSYFFIFLSTFIARLMFAFTIGNDWIVVPFVCYFLYFRWISSTLISCMLCYVFYYNN